MRARTSDQLTSKPLFLQIQRFWRARGPRRSLRYSYDTLDNLTGVTQGRQTRTFAYDLLRRLTSAANPESGTVTYGYDNNSNLTSKTDPRTTSGSHWTTAFAYDALNRVITKSYSNDGGVTPPVNYYYDNASLPSGAPSFTRGYSTGRLVAVTYGSSSSNGTYRGYDELGRVVRQYQQTDGVNYLTEATYYLNSAMATETYPSVPGASDRRTVSYSLDSAARLSSLSSSATTYAPAASVSSIAYAPHRALISETYGNGLIHAVTYNNRLQPNEIKLGTSGSPTSIVDLTYSYGTTTNNGNVQSIGYSGGGLSYTQSFGYDSLNRLTTSSESGSAWSQTNAYDRYGNRQIDYGGGSYNLAFSSTTNRITTSGYSYDAAGNLTNDTVHAYTFDAENKILKVDTVSAYVYDGEGQRVRKLVGENLRFIYGIGGQEIAEFSGASGALQKEYIYGASGLVATIEPTAVNSNGTRYMTSDNLGTPRVITNSSAGVISRHDYKPFGEEIGAGTGGRTTGMGYSVADGIRQRFTSKERDNETALDYFGARYYASAQGRFTSADSYGGRLVNPQTLNLYTYVRNNPLKYVDSTGHQDEYPKKKGKKGQEEEFLNTEDTPEIVIINAGLGDPPPVPVLSTSTRITQMGLQFNNFMMQQTVRFASGGPIIMAAEGLLPKDWVDTWHSPGVQIPLAMSVVGSPLAVEAEAEEATAAMEGEMDSLLEEGLTFDEARTLGFEKAGMTEANEVKFTKVDPETGTVVEFKGQGGAKVSYDGPHPEPGPSHDVPHIGWQSAGKRGAGGAVRGNIPYKGPQHPSRSSIKGEGVVDSH